MNLRRLKSSAAVVFAALLLVSSAGCSQTQSSSAKADNSVGSAAANETVPADNFVDDNNKPSKHSDKNTGPKSDKTVKETEDAAQEETADSADSKDVSADSSNSGNSSNWKRNLARFANFEEYEADRHLNAEDVFKKLTYTPRMFYGTYVNEDILTDGKSSNSFDDDAMAAYAKTLTYSKIKSNDEREEEIASVPYSIVAGPRTSFKYSKYSLMGSKYNWMTMKFTRSDTKNSGYVTLVTGAYYIEGKKLIFTPVTKYETDKEVENVTACEFSSESLEFDFEFGGGTLTLSRNGESTTLSAAYLTEKTSPYGASGFLSSTAKIDNIVGLNARRSVDNETQENKTAFSVYIERQDGYYDTYDNVAAHFNEDGIVKFSWADYDGTPHAYEYVYFDCGDDGYIFTDGDTKYYYTGSYSDYQLGTGIETSDDEALEKLDEGKIAAIAEKKKSLQDELMEAFEKEGIAVECNDETGEMMLDSSILFEVDKYELSSGGEEYLNKFMRAYSSVILKDDYEGFVSKIMVEGHTDSTGERAHNEELSKKRADEVLAYCVSDKTKIDSKVRSDMKSLMEAVGYADDYPILDEGGKEDKDKSRRVSFRFVIDMDNASKLEAPEKIDEEAEAKKAAENKAKEEAELEK